MAKVIMYSTGVCPYCLMAERLLKSKGVADIDLRHVGGYDDLAALDRAGGLDPLLSIEKVYVKDLSLEIPNAPQIFLERETAPQVDIQLHHNSTGIEEGVY